MATLKLHLFGQFRAYWGTVDQPLREWPHRKELQLLCFLLLHRQRRHARSVLAGLFWADSPEEQARKSLRTSLWRLRKVLDQRADPAEPHLLADNEDVCFNTRSDYWLDVEEFERTAAPVSEVSLIDALTTASELYQGDLLEGCYDDWCLAERERLRGIFLDILSTLVVHHRIGGRYEAAIRFSRLIVVHDPLLEDAHRELMELYSLTGNRGAALRQYRLCRETLARELGIEPAEPLRALHAQLARQDAVQGYGQDDVTISVAASRPAASQASLASQMDVILRRLHALQGEFQRNVESLEAARRQLEVDLDA